ncbi:MAG: hypothetical protein ACW99G_04995 [Candidatus Thorarchaeota archaeon]|jgi:hypothetical protein
MIVKIWDCDGEYLGVGFVEGVELVKGAWGWFSSLILLTTHGERLTGYDHMITPFSQPLLEYKPLLLEYHNG